LSGVAGAGKSAIAHTLCERLPVQSADRLGGAFFSERSDTTRGDARILFATLMDQLALHNRRVKSMISLTVDDDPVGRHMDIQPRKLVAEPCHSSPPGIVVIDGLDECDTPTAQEIISSIGS
ncbi:hypothetical protein B0H19DRAFT_893531, partial [Mycena capillaripes]